MVNELIVHAANGRGYEKFGAQYKYVLTDSNWNDFGYYTLHELFLITPNNSDNIKLADIRIFNSGQKCSDRLNFSITNYVAFISNLTSAERILLILNPFEREELLSCLHVRFSPGMYAHETAFLKSVLRDTTVIQFEEIQDRIKEILSIKLDISAMVQRNKNVLGIKYGV